VFPLWRGRDASLSKPNPKAAGHRTEEEEDAKALWTVTSSLLPEKKAKEEEEKEKEEELNILRSHNAVLQASPDPFKEGQPESLPRLDLLWKRRSNLASLERGRGRRNWRAAAIRSP